MEVDDINNCGPLSTETVTIFPTGINDNNFADLRIYPNPADERVTIEMSIAADEVSLEMLSLTGQVILSRKAHTMGGELRESIDVSGLAKGMYMIRVDGRTLPSALVVK